MSARDLLIHALSVACATGTAVTNLVVAVAVIPFWKSIEPEDFLDWFSRYANRFGLISPPLGLLGAGFTAWATVGAESAGPRWLWGLSSALLAASLAVLPLYFVPTNTRFYKRTIPQSDIARELQTWSRWHWIRTLGPLTAIGRTLWATAISG